MPTCFKILIFILKIILKTMFNPDKESIGNFIQIQDPFEVRLISLFLFFLQRYSR